MAGTVYGYWWDFDAGETSQMYYSSGHGGSTPSEMGSLPAGYEATMQPSDFSASYGGFSFNADTSDLMALMGGSGNGGYTDIKSALSNLANQTEAALKSNLYAYQAGTIDAATASANGYGMMNNMVSQMLSAGDIGLRSAAERDRRISNGAGLRWDWIAFYLDPIPGSTQTSGAASVPVAVLPTGQTGQAFTSGIQATDKQTLILAGAAVAVLLLMKLRK